MLNKKILSVLLVIGISGFSYVAHASKLTIVNHTNEASTVRVNDFKCSNEILGNDGVTQPHSTHEVTDSQIRLACILKPKNCKVDLYMTNNCSGPLITTLFFNVDSGLEDTNVQSNGYHLVGKGFQVTLDYTTVKK